MIAFNKYVLIIFSTIAISACSSSGSSGGSSSNDGPTESEAIGLFARSSSPSDETKDRLIIHTKSATLFNNDESPVSLDVTNSTPSTFIGEATANGDTPSSNATVSFSFPVF